MVRWTPGTRERLQEAALDLYLTRGYEGTTTADIARSVGLSERTFFRHFADKRDVLFSGQEILEQAFLEGVQNAPAHASALELIAHALDATGGFFSEERRGHSRRRQTVITANPALQERELLKMTSLAAALSAALRERGVPEPAATLAAQSGITVFGIAFAQWVEPGEQRTFSRLQREVLRELIGMAAQQA